MNPERTPLPVSAPQETWGSAHDRTGRPGSGALKGGGMDDHEKNTLLVKKHESIK